MLNIYDNNNNNDNDSNKYTIVIGDQEMKDCYDFAWNLQTYKYKIVSCLYLCMFDFCLQIV